VPDPVTANPWWGNPWTSDIEREAAADGQRAGSAFRWAASQAAREARSLTSPGEEDSTAVQSFTEAYQSLTADWPDVSPVISRHITRADRDEVKRYWHDNWRNADNPNDTLQCFDWAQYQLRVVDYRSTGSGRDPTTYLQLFIESADDRGARVDVTDTDATMEALSYVKDRLKQGIPVLVGIRMLEYPPRPNPDKTTNHFVVIVGMGRNEDVPTFEPQFYFEYFDYLCDVPLRFYLYNMPTLALAGLGSDPRVAQVRRTGRR
jgi:hypothetical protein